MTDTYTNYWNTVFGADYCATRVVTEFDLVPGPRHDLSEWLGKSEQDAASALGFEIPEEWTAFHQRALDELEAEIADLAD